MTKKQSKKMSVKTSSKSVSVKANPLTPEEQKQFDDIQTKAENTFEIEMNEEGQLQAAGHGGESSDHLLLKMVSTFGVGSINAGHFIMEELARVAMLKGSGSIQDANGMISLVDNISPQDDIEAMLASQMVATHTLIMDCTQRSVLKDQTLEGKNIHLNHVNKLMRTFTAQMDALNKHRGKGQQKMTVEHVHVNEGGQAVIGNVDAGGKRPTMTRGGKRK